MGRRSDTSDDINESQDPEQLALEPFPFALLVVGRRMTRLGFSTGLSSGQGTPQRNCCRQQALIGHNFARYIPGRSSCYRGLACNDVCPSDTCLSSFQIIRVRLC